MKTITIDQLISDCACLTRAIGKHRNRDHEDDAFPTRARIDLEFYDDVHPAQRWHASAVAYRIPPYELIVTADGASQWVALASLFRVLRRIATSHGDALLEALDSVEQTTQTLVTSRTTQLMR
jgi:hypothetical protein